VTNTSTAKAWLEKLLMPLAAVLVKSKTTKDQLTVLALFFSILYGLLLFMYPEYKVLWICLPLFLFLQTIIINVGQILVDSFKAQSSFDPFLHELASVLSDSAIYLPFIFLATNAYLAGVIFLILSIMTEMTRLLAIKVGATQNFGGPLGKVSRATLFSTAGVAFGFDYHPELYLAEFFSLLCILALATIFFRIKTALAAKQHSL
jgi:CDP-diacylglycerol--glycerol-3-phosphate 3-phosphatidyltransferase